MIKSKFKRVAAFALALMVGVSAFALTGCGGGSSADEQVIIYSNADDEAIEVMKNTLDENGYEGQYIVQTFGTSELGGKILAEGSDIEADLMSMSSYYIDSAQEQNKMFREISTDLKPLEGTLVTDYSLPILSNAGAIFVNTEEMKANNLPMPTSIKDLADPVYEGHISMIDVKSSSTAWLMIQALITSYGEDQTKDILKGIYKNAGAHIEESGSAPLKKVRAGEVAVGFGLRAQAVADKAEGLPIDYIDPTEGNFILTESIAVVDKGEDSNELAVEMAKCIVEESREAMLSYYPVPLYEGDEVSEENKLTNAKYFAEPLTVNLLEKHRALSEECK